MNPGGGKEGMRGMRHKHKCLGSIFRHTRTQTLKSILNFIYFSTLHLYYLTQYIVMSHQEGLIYFSLSEPALFLCGEEDFNSHSLSSPLAHPDLSVSPFSNLLNHLNLLGDCALNLATGYCKKSVV